MAGRDQPPSIQDGEFGYEPRDHDSHEYEGTEFTREIARKLARESYESSTQWINSGRRARWNDNLRAFQSLHPSGSKYLSRDYSYRSSLYRPKTRAMVRKAEAQTAAAFFSNEDVVSIQAEDDDDVMQHASAEIMQALLQYRLTKTIPWFVTLVGARQDCEVMGVCVAKAYWRFEDGPKRVDQPAVDLIPAENFRFEPGADWRDPVGTSPYLIELMPMYVADVREKVESGEWFDVSEGAMRSASDLDDDVTRRSREVERVPGKDNDSFKPRDFDICWVRNNIIRWEGQDYQFYTLGMAGELLTDPRPLEEVYLHGLRPYVAGSVVLETHKTYPAAKVEIIRDLQRAANDDWNLRFDNVKLALNPRQFVKKGAGIEIQDVRTFMPGKVVLVQTPQEDVVWDRPPDVTASAYAEQDRINLDFDELVGDFSNSSVQASQIQEQSATGMNLMSGMASGMNEYELRMFAETFVEPLIRLLVKIEQAYETDPVILAIAGKNAQIDLKYGMNEITDQLLNQELTCRVNVGIGATNPQHRLKNFVAGADIIGKIFGPQAAMGANFQEVAKEVFGMLGYKDGTRFFSPQFDPRVQMLQQQLQKAQGKGGGPNPGADQAKVQAAQMQAQSRIEAEKIKAQSQQQSDMLEFKKEQMQDQSEMQRVLMGQQHDVRMAMIGHQHDADMTLAQQAHASQQTAIGQQHEASMAHAGRQFEGEQAAVGRQHEQHMAHGAQQHATQLAAMKPVAGAGGGAIKALPPPAGDRPQDGLPDVEGSPSSPSLVAHQPAVPNENSPTMQQAIVQEHAAQPPQAPAAPAQQQMMPYMIEGLRQAAQHLSESLQQIAAGMAQNDQQIAELRKQLTAEKRIIRHPQTGRAVGIETVQ